jgi:hypothetical protein
MFKKKKVLLTRASVRTDTRVINAKPTGTSAGTDPANTEPLALMVSDDITVFVDQVSRVNSFICVN